MELTTWMIGWALVTTIVVVLAYYRLTLGLHEILGVHFGKGEAEFYREQLGKERRFNKVDLAGIALTALSALMMLVIIVLWAIESAGRA